MNKQAMKMMGGGVAIGLALVFAVVAAAASQGSSGQRRGPEAGTTSSTTIASGSSHGSPAKKNTTTTVAPPVDPLAGIAMVGIHDRRIIGLDPTGRELRDLGSAADGHGVDNAQLLGDHRTLWYHSWPENLDPAAHSCSDVVRLDLVTKKSTVVAHADAFSVSSDGSRLALSWAASATDLANGCRDIHTLRDVVRDIRTGAESPIVGDAERYVFSPDGRTLVGSECVADGCETLLKVAPVPAHLGAPITLRTVSDPAYSITAMTPGPDGLYVVFDKHPRPCLCENPPLRTDRDVSVRRLSWDNVGGEGTTLATLQGPLWLFGLVPTPSGVLAVGEESPHSGIQNLYRVVEGGTRLVRTMTAESDDWYDVLPIPAFGG